MVTPATHPATSSHFYVDFIKTERSISRVSKPCTSARGHLLSVRLNLRAPILSSRSGKMKRSILIAAALAAAPLTSAFADVRTWTGAGDGASWNDPVNWDGAAAI